MSVGPRSGAGPLSDNEFLVIEFDPRNAGLAVLDSLGYSARNRDDAVNDARQAAQAAADRGEPLHYLAVRIAVESRFGPAERT